VFRYTFHFEQLVDCAVLKWNFKMKRVIRVQARGAQDKWPVVAPQDLQHQALQRIIIKLTSVNERLNEAKRGMIIQVVCQFYITLQYFRHFGI
jgi:hypothetical protein